MPDSLQDTVAGTVAEVDRLFRTGKFQQSNDLIEALFERVRPTSYMLFCRGRNLRYLGDLDGAVIWLDQALAIYPTFTWSHFERAAVALYRGEFPGAAAFARAFVEALPRDDAADLNTVQKEILLKAAHASFALDRQGTAKLYECLIAADVRDYLTELRVAEAMFDRGDAQAAQNTLAELDARRGLDPWGAIIWVRVLRALGRYDEARDKACEILAASAPDSVLRVHACQRLLDLGESDLVAAQLPALRILLGGHPAHPAKDLVFRHACLAGGLELERLRDELQADLEQLKRFGDSALIEAVFALSKFGAPIDPLKRDVASMIVAHLRETRSYGATMVLAMLHHYQYIAHYAEADALLATIDDPAILDHPDITLRRFEIFCRTNRLAEALEVYEKDLSQRRLSGWEAAFVLRFLAEMNMESTAVDLLETILASGHDLPRDDFLMMQTVRRARGHRRIFDALFERMKVGSTPDLIEFRRLLVDDMCLRRGVARFYAFGQEWQASQQNSMLVHWHPPARRGFAENCIFQCTNRSYFLSALTFMMSAAAYSPGALNRFDWFFFLDDNVPEDWEEALYAVASAAGIEISIVREQDFLPDGDVDHMEAYGIFTGGVKLSRAAYFRIYAAVYLHALNRYNLACYFDTDIICQAELTPFLETAFGDALLMARLEEVNDDVIAASRRSGADPYRYFNSGVLAMNFRRPEIVEFLQQAIWLSEREPARLTFHDQCALNIAFKGQAGILDSKLNFFLRPNRPDETDGIEEAVLLHFLDRPKPWDIAFRLETRKYWEPHAREVRAVVDEDLFRAIVAASNGLKLALR